MDKQHFDISPVHPIESLRQVNLKNDAFKMTSLDGMNGFLCRTNRFMYLVVVEKRKLFTENEP